MEKRNTGVTLGWQFALRCLRDGWYIYSSNKGNKPQHWLVNPKRRNTRLFLDSRVVNRLKRERMIKSEDMGFTIRYTLDRSAGMEG